MVRDLPDERGESSFVTPYVNRTLRFDRLTATVQDMLVRVLEEVILRSEIPSEVRQEMTIVQKFETAPRAQEDSFETYTRLAHEWPHLKERLPAVGVLKPTGTTEKDTIGLNFQATVQEPPTITATAVEPYSLPISVRERRRITITAATLPAGTVLSGDVDGLAFSYTTTAQDSYDSAAKWLAHEIRLAAGYLVEVQVDGPVIDLRRWQGGQSFTLAVNASLTAALVTAASGTTAPAELVVRSTPHTRSNPNRAPVIETVVFSERHLEDGEDPSALSAAAVARMYNCQARYTRAEAFDNGGTPGLKFKSGGPAGGKSTPNEIEVLVESLPALVAALGLGIAGDVDSLTAHEDGLALASAGTGFTAALIDQVATVSGSGSALDNDGRFAIVSVPDGDTAVLDNPYGIPEDPSNATWFIGARSDWLDPDNPMKQRYGYHAQLTVPIAIMTESAVSRSELEGLVSTTLVHRAQEKLWEVLGPGFLSSDDADHDPLGMVQIVLHGKITTSSGSAQPRGGSDTVSAVHVSRLDVPMTVWVYVDRPVVDAAGVRLDIQPGDIGLL